MRAGVALSLLSSSTFQIGNLLQLSSFSRSIAPSSLSTTRNINLSKKPFHTVSAAMASSFMPEQARVPPAVELPAPPVTKFKIALCQLSVTEDKERNIAHARKAIEEAAEKGVDLVLLPAMQVSTSYQTSTQQLL
ncbi:Omega-amidase protein [Thalictrum thalictroides]|uniref:Omega-amidase protein n=1 Tax=Thalictrum thalictroides TaxID=46969 RepID=A0A7J6USL4_THATH|nr:Omega-amidase protein [Thalictrum thalictroides]